MKSDPNAPVSVDLIDEDGGGLSLTELRLSFHLSDDQLKEMVDEGLIEPLIQDADHWRFQAASLHRIRFALQLNRDLGVNWAGAALALELLDELKRLRALLRNDAELL